MYLIANSEYRHDICDSIDLHIENSRKTIPFDNLRKLAIFFAKKIEEWNLSAANSDKERMENLPSRAAETRMGEQIRGG